MAWCHEATSYYLSQCWPRSVSPYCVTGLQWVNILLHNHDNDTIWHCKTWSIGRHFVRYWFVACLAPSHYLNPWWPVSLQWRHNERDGVSNHQLHDCLIKRLFRHRSKKTSKLRVTGLCVGNSPVTGEFPAQNMQKASNGENVSIWWHHFVWLLSCLYVWNSLTH